MSAPETTGIADYLNPYTVTPDDWYETWLNSPAGQAQLAEEESPEYQAYLAELDAQEQRARERRGKPAPMAWGTDLGGDSYFCTACWYAGFKDGEHSHEHPPCDRPGLVRGPYDPR